MFNTAMASPVRTRSTRAGRWILPTLTKRWFQECPCHAVVAWLFWTSEHACGTNFCQMQTATRIADRADQTKYTTATYDLHFLEHVFDGGSDTEI